MNTFKNQYCKYMDMISFREYLLEKRKRKYKKRKSSSVKRRKGYGVWGYPWVGGYYGSSDSGSASGDSGGAGGGDGGN
jgi:hypothetical protein